MSVHASSSSSKIPLPHTCTTDAVCSLCLSPAEVLSFGHFHRFARMHEHGEVFKFEILNYTCSSKWNTAIITHAINASVVKCVITRLKVHNTHVHGHSWANNNTYTRLLNPAHAMHGGVSYFASVCVCLSVCVSV